MSRSTGAKKKKNYTPDVLAEAVTLVKNKSITLSCAARSYSIPKTTLHNAITGKYATSKQGPRTVLTTDEETRLADWAMTMSKIGYGRTRKELLTKVKKILDEDGRKNPFKDNMPGRDWYRGFVKRHPELTERSPMQLGKERAVISPFKVKRWFSDLQDFVKNDIKDENILKDPSRLYNADESGFPLCPKSSKVIAMKGAKNVYNCTSSNKSQITVLACVSAVGHYIEPMIVYPGERLSSEINQGFGEAAIGRSSNGWMDSELFLTWLTDVFIPSLDKRQVKRPVLLFVDGHSTHVSIDVSDTCLANGIQVFCLLEHASHLIQPLDLRVFGVLKENWCQAVRDYQLENIPNIVTKRSFAQVFRIAWEKSATVENAVNAFRYAGLFPLNMDIVLSTAKMEPSKLYMYQQPSESTRAPSPIDEPQSNGPSFESIEESNTSQTSVTSVENTRDTTPNEPTEAATNVEDSVNTMKPNDSPGTSQSLFSKHLTIPTIKYEKKKIQRVQLPKAITGEAFRKIMIERKEMKEKIEREKQERKIERERKKKEKEEEKIVKQKEREAKKRQCEEKRLLKSKEKEVAKKLQKFQKRKRLESSTSSSDSSGSFSAMDDSEYEIIQDNKKCYKCELPYDDSKPLEWIACDSCPRLFHRKCTDVDFDKMNEEEIEMFPFKCLFC